MDTPEAEKENTAPPRVKQPSSASGPMKGSEEARLLAVAKLSLRPTEHVSASFLCLAYRYTDDKTWKPIITGYTLVHFVFDHGGPTVQHSLRLAEADVKFSHALTTTTKASCKENFVRWQDATTGTFGARFSTKDTALEFCEKLNSVVVDLSPYATIEKHAARASSVESARSVGSNDSRDSDSSRDSLQKVTNGNANEPTKVRCRTISVQLPNGAVTSCLVSLNVKLRDILKKICDADGLQLTFHEFQYVTGKGFAIDSSLLVEDLHSLELKIVDKREFRKGNGAKAGGQAQNEEKVTHLYRATSATGESIYAEVDSSQSGTRPGRLDTTDDAWRTFLDVANIHDSELSNPNKVQLIEEFVADHGGDRFLAQIGDTKQSKHVIEELHHLASRIAGMATSPERLPPPPATRPPDIPRPYNPVPSDGANFALRRAASEDMLMTPPAAGDSTTLPRSKKRQAPRPPPSVQSAMHSAKSLSDLSLSVSGSRASAVDPPMRRQVSEGATPPHTKRKAPPPPLAPFRPDVISPTASILSTNSLATTVSTISPPSSPNFSPRSADDSSRRPNEDLPVANREETMVNGLAPSPDAYKPPPIFVPPPPPDSPPPEEVQSPIGSPGSGGMRSPASSFSQGVTSRSGSVSSNDGAPDRSQPPRPRILNLVATAPRQPSAKHTDTASRPSPPSEPAKAFSPIEEEKDRGGGVLSFIAMALSQAEDEDRRDDDQGSPAPPPEAVVMASPHGTPDAMLHSSEATVIPVPNDSSADDEEKRADASAVSRIKDEREEISAEVGHTKVLTSPAESPRHDPSDLPREEDTASERGSIPPADSEAAHSTSTRAVITSNVNTTTHVETATPPVPPQADAPAKTAELEADTRNEPRCGPVTTKPMSALEIANVADRERIAMLYKKMKSKGQNNGPPSSSLPVDVTAAKKGDSGTTSAQTTYLPSSPPPPASMDDNVRSAATPAADVAAPVPLETTASPGTASVASPSADPAAALTSPLPLAPAVSTSVAFPSQPISTPSTLTSSAAKASDPTPPPPPALVASSEPPAVDAPAVAPAELQSQINALMAQMQLIQQTPNVQQQQLLIQQQMIQQQLLQQVLQQQLLQQHQQTGYGAPLPTRAVPTEAHSDGASAEPEFRQAGGITSTSLAGHTARSSSASEAHPTSGSSVALSTPREGSSANATTLKNERPSVASNLAPTPFAPTSVSKARIPSAAITRPVSMYTRMQATPEIATDGNSQPAHSRPEVAAPSEASQPAALPSMRSRSGQMSSGRFLPATAPPPKRDVFLNRAMSVGAKPTGGPPPVAAKPRTAKFNRPLSVDDGDLVYASSTAGRSRKNDASTLAEEGVSPVALHAQSSGPPSTPAQEPETARRLTMSQVKAMFNKGDQAPPVHTRPQSMFIESAQNKASRAPPPVRAKPKMASRNSFDLSLRRDENGNTTEEKSSVSARFDPASLMDQVNAEARREKDAAAVFSK